jgi:uncharacterized protein
MEKDKEFTQQETAYLDVLKQHQELNFIIEKLAIMEMPCSVIDELEIAVKHIENAKDILFEIINGNGDKYLD